MVDSATSIKNTVRVLNPYTISSGDRFVDAFGALLTVDIIKFECA